MIERGGPLGRPWPPTGRPWPPRGGPPPGRDGPPGRACAGRCMVAGAGTGRCEAPFPPLTVTGEGWTSVAWSSGSSTRPTVAGWCSESGRTGSGISRVAAASAGAPTPAGAAGGNVEPGAPTPAGVWTPPYAGGNPRAGGAYHRDLGRQRRDLVRQRVQLALELLHALPGLVGAAPEVRRLAGLGEEQQHEQRHRDEGSEPGIGSHRGDEVVHREGKRNRHHVARAQSTSGVGGAGYLVRRCFRPLGRRASQTPRGPRGPRGRRTESSTASRRAAPARLHRPRAQAD